MSFRDHILTFIATVMGGLAVIWLTTAPQGKVAITADWIKVDVPGFIHTADLKKVLAATGIPADEPLPMLDDLALVHLTIGNTSNMEAKNVNLHVADAVLAYEPASNAITRPKGKIPLGSLLPYQERPVYLMVPAGYFSDSAVEKLSATADGVAVPIQRRKMMSMPMPLMDRVVLAMNNSIMAQTIVLMALGVIMLMLVMMPISIYAHYNQAFRVRYMQTPQQRRLIVEDADYIRQIYGPDYKEAKKPAS
jgi:hypothetical protein